MTNEYSSSFWWLNLLWMTKFSKLQHIQLMTVNSEVNAYHGEVIVKWPCIERYSFQDTNGESGPLSLTEVHCGPPEVRGNDLCNFLRNACLADESLDSFQA